MRTSGQRYACDTYEQGDPHIDDEDIEAPSRKQPVQSGAKPKTYEVDEPLDDPFP